MSFDLSQYSDIIEKYRIQLYQPTVEQDLLLLRWWMHLNETGDLAELFLPASHSLSRFYSLFQPPTATIYTLSTENQIDIILWFTPFDTHSPSAFCALWVKKNLRKSRKFVEACCVIYQAAFQLWPQIFGVTRTKHIDKHKKIGYDIIGTIPGFYPDEVGVNVSVTEKSFAKGQAMELFKRIRGTS